LPRRRNDAQDYAIETEFEIEWLQKRFGGFYTQHRGNEVKSSLSAIVTQHNPREKQGLCAKKAKKRPLLTRKEKKAIEAK
jgi:hypothetical protein